MEGAMQAKKDYENSLASFCEQVVDEIHDAVVGTDLNGVVTSWNRGAERLFGYRADEALGRHISFVYPDDQHPFLQEQVIDPLLTKGRHEVQVRMLRKSGEEFLAHLLLSTLRDASGRPVGMVGYSQDVTAESQATAALETRLRQQSAISQLGARALEGGDFAALLQEAVSLIAENLHVEYTKVLELLRDGRSFLLRAGVGWREGSVGTAIVAGGVDSQAGYTLESKEPVIVGDLATETRFSGPELLNEHHIVSGISVIIHGRSGPYGVLGAHTPYPRRFTGAEIDFLQAMANVLAAAVQRREVEQTLQESEQRFRQLAEHVEETFWMLDADSGKVIYASPSFERTWGVPRASLYEKPDLWLDAVVSEDRARVARSYTPERLARGDFSEEYRIARPDGAIRWIKDRGYPVRDEEQRVVRIAGLAQDITTEKEAQETLRRHSELLDIAHDAILVRDLRTRRVTYWNRAAERLYGWSREEAVGQLPEELLRSKYPQPLSEIEVSLNHEGYWQGELIQQRRDATSMVVHSEWILQHDEQGEPLALMQVNDEVDTSGSIPTSELERLVALVDTSPVAILAVDADGKILFADREAWQFFGLHAGSHDQLTQFENAAAMQKPSGEPYLPDEWPLRRALARGESIRAEEVTFEFHDGRTLTGLVNATPFYGSQARITGAVATIQDLSPIEQLEKMRNDFLAIVSHELKTPLTVIKGAAAFALGGKEADRSQTRELLQMVSEQADRLQELIGNLSDSARIESGSFSVDVELTDIGSTIEEATKSFQQSGIPVQIEPNLNGSLPHVLADRQRIIQVIHNLLSNAAKHSPPASTVSVTTHHDGLQARICVSDSGPGVREDQIPRLFKKYSRVDEPTGAFVPGSGLGLYISKGIVEAHGGRIWLESSSKESGAVFCFTLPVAPGDSAVDWPAEEGSRRNPVGIRPTGVRGRRVVAVDDDGQILRLLRRTLQESGFDCTVTTDGTKVIELVEATDPALVLLDLALPHASGFDLLKRIREFSSVPVIFLTASEREEDLVRALKLGADDYISKPFSTSELTARMEAAIRAHAASTPVEDRRPFNLGDLHVDFAARRVSVGQNEVRLSAGEYTLLYELVTNAGRVLTHDQLLQRVWGEAYLGEFELLRSLVRRLRHKLGDDARNPRFIFNEPQVGYRVPKP
jgi:PAS domain S-box-containing protein